MNNIFLTSRGLFNFEDKEQVKNEFENFKVHDEEMSFETFEQLLLEKYEMINERLIRFFNFAKDKFFFYFKTKLTLGHPDTLKITIKPKVILNYYDEKYDEIEKILNKENVNGDGIDIYHINFYNFKSISNRRPTSKIEFIEEPIEYNGVYHVDYALSNYYSSKSIARNVKYFKNKILYYITGNIFSEYSIKEKKESILKSLSNYLDYKVDFNKEMKLIKKNEIDKKYNKNDFLNNYILENKDELENKDNDFNKNLESIFENSKEKLHYKELLFKIDQSFKINTDKEIYHDVFMNSLKEKEFYFKQNINDYNNDAVDIIVIDDDVNQKNIDKIKKIIFDNYLDATRNVDEAVSLLVDYIEDYQQIFYDILIGHFGQTDSHLRFYEQVQEEIIQDDHMSLNKLLDYFYNTKRTIIVNNKKYKIIVKYF